jgi:hypothetical protein
VSLRVLCLFFGLAVALAADAAVSGVLRLIGLAR